MRITERYTYLWTILCGIPFGITMLVGAYNLFNSIPKIEFQKYSGYITDWGEIKIKSEVSNDKLPVFAIRFPEKEFYTEITKRKDILRAYIPHAFKDKKIITIWTEKGSSMIEQLSIENKIVLKYKSPYWQAWTFLIIGLVFSIMGIIYLFKYYKTTWKTKRIK